MKLLRRHDDRFVFGFEPVEKRALLDTLTGSPSVPRSHHRLSKSSLLATTENQRLLDDSLAAQRAQNQKQVATLLMKPERLKRVANKWQFTVTRLEIELLLQVLNDVRVGSWIALGSPDFEQENGMVFDEKTLPLILQMELAGHLEDFFVRVVSGEIPLE